MSLNVWNRPSGSFMVDMGISSNIMKSLSPKYYMTFWDMTIYNDTLNWLHQFANLLPNWTLLPILNLSPNFGGFHRTLQRVRLASRGRLLLRTPGHVPICSNVETILSWTCHVYGPFEFRTSLGTSILLIRYARACISYGCFILRATLWYAKVTKSRVCLHFVTLACHTTRLSNKLLEQGYVKDCLKSSLRKFYGRYLYLIKQYEVFLSQMLNYILWPDHIQWQPPTDQTLYQTRPFTEFWEVSTGFATGVACRQGTLTPPDPWSHPFETCICSTCWDQYFFRTC